MSAVLERRPRIELPTLEAIRAEKARRSLRAFVEQAWPIVEPEAPFVANWHIDRLCRILEAVSSGEVRRLIVNVPPGTSKSLIVSVFWPAWQWIHAPSRRMLVASYSDTLTIRDNLRVRDIITSEWYQRYWPVRFRSDQNAKTRMDTVNGGWRIATSVGGRATGEHPDIVIIDDPTNPKQSVSELERQSVNDWFDGTIATRGVSRGVRIVVIMQRLHQSDLSGHLLSRTGWRHVCWPMRFDRAIASLDDQRTQPGELLWPSLFDEAKVKQLEIDLGAIKAAGQLQQRPVPAAGALFQREWFSKVVDVAPVNARRCRGWDTAATENGGDYTVGVKIAEADGIFYVEDVVRGQLSPHGVEAMMDHTIKADGYPCRQREEQSGSGDKTIVAIRVRRYAGYDFAGVTVSSDKATRADAFRAQCEGGNVRVVKGAWNKDYVDELCLFPNGDHDDQVDASSCAFNALAQTPPPFTPVSLRGI